MHAQMQRQAHLQAALVVMAEEDMVRAVPDGGPGRAQLSPWGRTCPPRPATRPWC